VRKEILAWQEYVEGILKSKHPVIGGVGVLSLAKGESKRITHTINWAQYESDDITIKATASDPSITVPAELKLTFERHQFKFDYDIKAGTKEGTYKVTLTPAVGPPIEVQVIVK
jgi:hypothetical protein